MIIKHNIQFGLKRSSSSKLQASKDLPIRMRISYKGHRLDVPIGVSVSSESWNNDKQLVQGNYINSKGQEASDINALISCFRQVASNVIKKYEVENTIPSEEMLRQSIKLSYSSNIINCLSKESIHSKDFWKIYDEFITVEGENRSWSPAQVEKFRALKTDLMKYRPKTSFDDIDENYMSGFVFYLRDEKILNTPRKRKGSRAEYDKDDIVGMRSSSIIKKLEYLRWFLRWAMKKQYHSNKAFEEFNPMLKTTNNSVVFLTISELKTLSEYEIPANKPSWSMARDFLLFASFTGLRYSDIKNLRKSDVTDNVIDVTTIKTGDTIRVDLNSVSRKILEKYRNVPTIDDVALPICSGQKLNQTLKELCQAVGFCENIRRVEFKGNERIEEWIPKYELISTHVGRRSFICNCLAKGIPAEVVMKWTGHSDYKAMKPYIDVADKIKSSEMQKMDISDITIKK